MRVLNTESRRSNERITVDLKLVKNIYLSQYCFLFDAKTKGTSQTVPTFSFDNCVGVICSYLVNSTFEFFIYENCSTVIDRNINCVNSIYFNTGIYLVQRTVV